MEIQDREPDIVEAMRFPRGRYGLLPGMIMEITIGGCRVEYRVTNETETYHEGIVRATGDEAMCAVGSHVRADYAERGR